MTKEQALEHAKEMLEVHQYATETLGEPMKSGEQERAEICKMIIDALEGRTPTGDVKKAIYVLTTELERNKRTLAVGLVWDVDTAYSESYKRSCDWLSCCIEALDNYF